MSGGGHSENILETVTFALVRGGDPTRTSIGGADRRAVLNRARDATKCPRDRRVIAARTRETHGGPLPLHWRTLEGCSWRAPKHRRAAGPATP